MRLPPLNALRAFEAAARHQGYIAAAEELCVTRGAISRHVKLLEEHLGVALFHRGHKGVALTEAGQDLLPVLTETFTRIATQVAQLSEQAAELRIICPPTLSIRWLFPKLARFRQLHPEIQVRLTTDFYGDSGFDPTRYDLGVSLEVWPGRSADVKTQAIFPMRLSPACSPALMAGSHALRTPADLGRVTLLHESAAREDWQTWVRHFEIKEFDPTRGEAFPNLDMATKAAVMGAGVVMADLALCQEELQNGTLVLPFPDMACDTPHGSYALIGSEDRWHAPNVKTFRDWIATEHRN
ncbi:LysR substrate-binding domain-containing protein [Nioella aestuarii]|uniref:LysR substrate-binding domain-containing protein n=1 Tax=Nioella aestuarii TaxID=1662864 RepID=UPI003D7FA378